MSSVNLATTFESSVTEKISASSSSLMRLASSSIAHQFASRSLDLFNMEEAAALVAVVEISANCSRFSRSESVSCLRERSLTRNDKRSLILFCNG